MALNPDPDPEPDLDALSAIPASDVKKRGWRGVLRTLDEQSAVLVTNHGRPEAVIMDVRGYKRLAALAGQAKSRSAAELDALRRSFDQRLAALRRRDAGDRLRALARRPARLRGKVKAGSGF